MNKKLTTIMLAVLLLLMGKVDAATLTQYIGEHYISQTVNEGQTVRLRFINQSNYTFTKWTVESGNVTIDTTNPTITFTMPNSDVVIRGNYSEEVAAPQNYTITYNSNGGTGSMTAQTVTVGESVTLTTNTFTYDGYAFKGWSIDSSATSATYTDGQSITPTANVVLYAVWEQQGTLLSDVATVGAYVTYVPSSTSYTVPTTVSGYTSDQSFNPSNTTSWRVFSVDGENIEIISTDSVDNLSLEGREGYVSSNSGCVAYTNAIQTLNDMSVAYVNSTYATSGRCLGYSESGLTKYQIENYKVIDTATYPLEYGISDIFPYSDSQLNADRTVLINNSTLGHSSGYVWLASRNVGSYDNDIRFYMNIMETNPVVLDEGYASNYLYYVNSDGFGGAYPNTYGVRPIITLKSGITVTGGSGTVDAPYVINESNPSQYTVTYSANGGYGEMNPQSVSQGSSLTLTTNAYEHHSKAFLGWSIDSSATSATYTNGQTITPTSDITLYAVWESVNGDISGSMSDDVCNDCGMSKVNCAKCYELYCEGCNGAYIPCCSVECFNNIY